MPRPSSHRIHAFAPRPRASLLRVLTLIGGILPLAAVSTDATRRSGPVPAFDRSNASALPATGTLSSHTGNDGSRVAYQIGRLNLFPAAVSPPDMALRLRRSLCHTARLADAAL